MSLQREILSPVTTAGILFEDELKVLPQEKSCVTPASRADISYLNGKLLSDAEYGVERVTVDEDIVQCLICKRKMKGITNTHLKKHDLTLEEYQQKFPGAEMWHLNRVSWLKGLTQETDERVKLLAEKTKNSIQLKYGVDNIAKVPEVMEKMVSSRRKIDNYGLGIPKPGTSEKLKGKPKSEIHCQHISDAVKLEYQTNPKRREISSQTMSKIISKSISRKNFVFTPQYKMFEILKKYYPEAKLEFMVRISKNHRRYLDVAIPSLKLDFEYDGFIHTYLTPKEEDIKRDKELNKLGWKTIRIDKTLLKNLEQYLLTT